MLPKRDQGTGWTQIMRSGRRKNVAFILSATLKRSINEFSNKPVTPNCVIFRIWNNFEFDPDNSFQVLITFLVGDELAPLVIEKYEEVAGNPGPGFDYTDILAQAVADMLFVCPSKTLGRWYLVV